MDQFALKGNILFTQKKEALSFFPHAYVVCRQGVCQGVFQALPEKYRGIPVTDYGDALIIPGLVDLHIHAPQYTFRGTGMDCELLQWLRQYAFPEEA